MREDLPGSQTKVSIPPPLGLCFWNERSRFWWLSSASESRQQLGQSHLPLSEQRVPLQAGALVHHLELDGEVLHLNRADGVEEEVLVEDRVAAVLDDVAPLLLQLAGVQVHRHAAVDAFDVEVLVVEALRRHHPDEQARRAGVVVGADPHRPTFVQVDDVLPLEAGVGGPGAATTAVQHGHVEPPLDVGAGLGRAALVGGEGAVAGERALGLHHLGLRLVGEDLEQGGGAGQQRRAEGRGLGRGAGVALAAAEVAIWVHVRSVAVGRVQVVPCFATFPRSLPLRVWRGDGTGELAVEQRLFAASVGAFLQGRKAV